MSEQKSVLVPVLIGCGLVALLVVLMCGGAAIFFVPRVMEQAEQMAEQFEQEMVKQQMLASFPEDWQPPAEDVSDEELFPETVGTFQLESHDTEASLPDYGLDEREGRHAVYESALSTIDVYAYAVSTEDHREAMRAVKDAVMENFDTHVTSSFSQANYEILSFTVSPPATTGWLLWSEGWMFLFLSEEGFAPTMFQSDYLDAIQPFDAEESEEALETTDSADVSEASSNDEAGQPPPPPEPVRIQSGDEVESVP